MRAIERILFGLLNRVERVMRGFLPGVERIMGRIGNSMKRRMRRVKRVSRSQAVPGDLVFFLSGGRTLHVGIYAGGNMMYDAQRTGKSFTPREIYSANVGFGRY